MNREPHKRRSKSYAFEEEKHSLAARHHPKPFERTEDSSPRNTSLIAHHFSKKRVRLDRQREGPRNLADERSNFNHLALLRDKAVAHSRTKINESRGL